MKKLIVLILCLSLPLLANSQTPSNNDCIVPCSALTKALLIKNDHNYLVNQIGIVRDSVFILSKIITNQDSVIKSQDSSITLYKSNENSFNTVLSNKDSIITLYNDEIDRQKGLKNKAYVATVVTIILSLVIIL